MNTIQKNSKINQLITDAENVKVVGKRLIARGKETHAAHIPSSDA